MSLSRTLRRRRGDTSRKRREDKIDHRVSGYLLTDKGAKWLMAMKISGRSADDLQKGQH
jgi:hypothetical protein